LAEVTPIIVNYRTADLTQGAVRSCLTEPEVEEVIVIDNGSDDESADVLSDAFRGQNVRVLENEDNVGFATANNKGIGKAKTEFVFLLNSDAFLVPGCLGPLVARMRADESVGIAAPLILESDGATPQPRNYGPFPTLNTILTRNQHVPDELNPDWVSGVAMLMRREFVTDLEGFDDRYFMYFEDVDLCRRVRASGKKIVREPEARVVHFGGKSLSSDFKRKKMYYASQDRYLELTDVAPFGRNLVKVTRWPVYVVKSIVGR
jgi:N-acetylglucosaminyl-diphospho-decaprenol L-rhamnosyltransferase